MEYLAQCHNEPAGGYSFTLIDFPGQVVLNLAQSFRCQSLIGCFLVLTAAG